MNFFKKKWKKILIGLIIFIGFLFVVLVLLPGLFSLMTSDVDPPNIEDLMPETINIPEEENAYYQLILIEDVLSEDHYKLGNVYINYMEEKNEKAWDEDLVEELILKNKEAFRLFDEAMEKPKFQDPACAKLEDINTFCQPLFLSDLKSIARGLIPIRSLYLFKNGEEKQAFDEAIKLIKFGQKIQESQADGGLQLLVSFSIKRIGINTLIYLTENTSLDPDELVYYINEIDKIDNLKNNEDLVNLVKMESIRFINAVDLVVSMQLNNFFNFLPSDKTYDNFYFRPNKTKQLIANRARNEIKLVKQHCAFIKEANKEWQEIPLSFKLYFTENALGKIIDNTLMHLVSETMFRGIHENKCQKEFLLSASQVLLAIKAYTIDNNDYPLSLDELVPKYINKIPNDSFSDESIKYDPSKKIIYSVGKEGIDLGGSEGETPREMPNPTIKFDF